MRLLAVAVACLSCACSGAGFDVGTADAPLSVVEPDAATGPDARLDASAVAVPVDSAADAGPDAPACWSTSCLAAFTSCNQCGFVPSSEWCVQSCAAFEAGCPPPPIHACP